MKIPREIPSMRRTDNSLKEVMTNLCSQKNFRRIFLNQAIPVLSLFANQSTMVLLYFIYNADTNNVIFCTYEDIMQDCAIVNKRTVANTIKTLQETRAIAKISKSHYMLNPALMLQGNNEKFGLLANTFNDYITLYEKEKNHVSE
ncbi:hypothetical protein DW779_15465 [Clostridium sp. AM30-24]|nr:replication/maintenance protein RepL [Clostridium sp. AM30-24]RHT37242.1 hypothetical protein DW779_15465 [Clostridium sp. AM30-24]